MKRLYVVALALLLSGCGGDPPPAAPPPPSPSPSHATAAALVMPEGAKENTKAGAFEFVKHYVGLLNYAQATGDTVELRATGGDKCAACTRVAQSVDRLYSLGGHLDGGDWRTGAYVAAPDPSTGNWLITVRISYSAQTSHEPGKNPKKFTGGSAVYDFLTGPASNRRVLRWSRVD